MNELKLPDTDHPATSRRAAVEARACRVLETEAAGLAQLAAHLPEDFARIVELILSTSGRVAVSGIGKSGHVGSKIAATLASTGTRAFFVHPSETSHGDLGMIGDDDILILISNSGETTELGDLLAYARRFAIPVVGISKRVDSTLMRASDYRLTLPDAEEACGIGMAPTTSSTMTMALGDALAAALMEQRGFTREDFRKLHPGGKLGAQLAHVSQFMHGPEKVPVVTSTTPMTETLLTMTSAGFGLAGVVSEEGRLTGVVTDGDLRRHMDGLLERTAGEVATREPVTVSPTTMAADALALMNGRGVTVLLVVDERRHPAGVLHIHDLLRAGVA